MKHIGVVGLLLCSVLAFSVYAGVVRFVGELFQRDFIDEIRITGHSQDETDPKFKIGSVLNVTATLNDANTYLLDVYDNNDSLVYHTDGDVNGSQIVTEIPLLPPIFTTGQAYEAVFTAGIFNYPLYGTCIYSSLGSTFTVINSYTKLNFTVAYDTEQQQLNAASVLYSDSLKPLENMMVSLYLMPNVDHMKPDRGWILLDTAQTDANGRISSSFALDMMGGRHALQARFTGDDNFGSCSKSQYFNVTFKPPHLKVVKVERQNTLVDIVLQLVDKYDSPLRGKLLSFEALNITGPLYAITDDTGRAALNFRLDNLVNVFDARFSVSGDDYISAYQACGRLNASASDGFMISKWGETGSGSLRSLNDNAVSLRLADSSTIKLQTRTLNSSWVDISLIPSPGADAPCVDLHENVKASFAGADSPGPSYNLSYYLKDTSTQNETYKGSTSASYSGHTPGNETEFIYTGILVWWPDSSGNFTFRVVAKDEANYTVAEGESEPFCVKRGNVNLAAYLPSASNGNSTALTVGFAKARTYNDTSNSYFTTTRLAPIIHWNNTYYAVDQGTNSSWIDVYVNGTKICGMVPDAEGLCSMPLALNYSDAHFSLNVTAVSNQTRRYESGIMQQIINFTRVNVLEDPCQPANCSTCAFNYTLAVLDGERTYINLNNTVAANAMVLDQPVFNVSASFTAFNVSSRVGFGNATVFANVSACQYLLVKNASFPNNSTALNVAADVNLDGKIDMKDVGFVAAKYGKNFLTSPLLYDCHADLNGDLETDMRDVGSVSQNYGKVVRYVQGSFDYRTIAVDFNVSGSLTRRFLDGRGFVEVPSGASRFNMSHWGTVDFLNSTWQTDICSNSIGEANAIWNPSVMGIYAFRVKLPSALNLTVAMNTDQTQISGCLNLAGYYYVIKRAINYTVDSQSVFHTETLTAYADTYVVEDDGASHGSQMALLTGFQGEDERITYVGFNLSCIPSAAYIISARLNLYKYLTYGSGDSTFEVCKITEDWNETIGWDDRPSYETPAICNFTDVGTSTGWRLLNVTATIQDWLENISACFGFAIIEIYGQKAVYFRSREYTGDVRLRPALEVSYLDPSPEFFVSSYDRALQAPVCDMPVKVYANGNLTATGTTNSSGMLDFSSWIPSANIVYNMTVGSEADDTYAVSNGSSVHDYRWPAVLSSLDGNSTSMQSGATTTFNFSLTSSGLFDLEGVVVKFYVNGTFTDKTVYSCSGTDTTSQTGLAQFEWTAPHTGAYSVKAFLEGNNTNYLPCETYVSVSVETIPLSILFSVSPTEFKVGDLLTLNATIISPFTGQRFTQTVEVQFLDYSSDGSNSTLDTVNSTDGVALKNVTYPDDAKAHAYAANITRCIGESAVVQNVISSPVQLTVGVPTRLKLWIHNGASQTERHVEGFLILEENLYGISDGLGNRQITVRINQTELNMTTSNDDWWEGYFSYDRDFLPDGNESALYIITTSFNGETPVNSTVWAKTLDGQDYAVCTTSQYAYRPSCNVTCLTAEPISSITSMLTKTPDEMQKDAEAGGWFRVDPEFSWWYPWFRCHLKISRALPQGQLYMDYGWSPLPFGQTFECNEVTAYLINDLANEVYDVGKDVLLSLVRGYFVSMVIQHLAAWLLGKTLFGVLVAIAAYAAVCLIETAYLYMASGNDPYAWLAAFIASSAGGTLGLLRAGLNRIVNFFTAAGRRLMQEIDHIMNSLWARGLDFFDITGIAFSLTDFCFVAWYLIQFVALIG